MEDHRDVKDIARPAQSTHEEEYGKTSIDKNEATTEAHEAALSVTKQLICLKENKANTDTSSSSLSNMLKDLNKIISQNSSSDPTMSSSCCKLGFYLNSIGWNN